MKKFMTTQSDLINLNGKIVIDQKPLSKSEFDFDEVGAMWRITLETGESLECFDDELVMATA